MKGRKTTPRQPLLAIIKGAAVSGLSLTFKSPVLSYRGYFKSGGYSMNNTNNKRFYTPQFSETASVSVRRFAWFLNKPMTQAVEKIILLLPFILDASKVCQTCKDSRRCNSCAFNVKKLSEDEQYKVLTAL